MLYIQYQFIALYNVFRYCGLYSDPGESNCIGFYLCFTIHLKAASQTLLQYILSLVNSCTYRRKAVQLNLLRSGQKVFCGILGDTLRCRSSRPRLAETRPNTRSGKTLECSRMRSHMVRDPHSLCIRRDLYHQGTNTSLRKILTCNITYLN